MKRLFFVLAILAVALVIVLPTAQKNVAVAQEPPTPTPALYNQVGMLDLIHDCDVNTGYLVLQDGTRAKIGMPHTIYMDQHNGKMLWMRGYDRGDICHDPVFWTDYWSPVISFSEPWPDDDRQFIDGYVMKTENRDYDWLFKQFVQNPDGVGLIVEHDPALVAKLTEFAYARTRLELEVVHTVDHLGTPGRIWWVFDAHVAPTPTPVTPEPSRTPTPRPEYHVYLPSTLGVEDGAQPAPTFIDPNPTPEPTVCPFPTCLP